MLAINFVPDPARGLAEFRRVTRPGGRIAACVWDYGGGMSMLHAFWDAAIALDSNAAGESAMSLCRQGELAALWREAGLADVRDGSLTIEMTFESFDDFWQPFLAGVGPAGGYVAGLTEDRRRGLEEKLRADFWEDQPDRPRTLPARAWAVAGIVPRG